MEIVVDAPEPFLIEGEVDPAEMLMVIAPPESLKITAFPEYKECVSPEDPSLKFILLVPAIAAALVAWMDTVVVEATFTILQDLSSLLNRIHFLYYNILHLLK